MTDREIAEKAARWICRELYDRFAMGGWVPEDAHEITSAAFLRAIEESRQPAPTHPGDAYGYCEYSAIHRDTAHFLEPGCINWKPIYPAEAEEKQ